MEEHFDSVVVRQKKRFFPVIYIRIDKITVGISAGGTILFLGAKEIGAVTDLWKKLRDVVFEVPAQR